MKFSAGRHKGKEIAEVALKNPDYIQYIATRHWPYATEEEYNEIQKVYHQTDLFKMTQLDKLSQEELDTIYTGKYMKCKKELIFIKKIQANSKNIEKVHVVYVFNWWEGSCLERPISYLGEKIITFTELLTYSFCKPEEYERNFRRTIGTLISFSEECLVYTKTGFSEWRKTWSFPKIKYIRKRLKY